MSLLAPEILPRFRGLCAEPVEPARLVAAGEPVHVVIARPTVDAVTVDQVTALIGALGIVPTLWIGAKANVDDDIAAGLTVPMTRIDVAGFAYPRSGTLAFVGMESSPGAWLEHCRPTRIALLCDEYLPGPLIDRLRELSDEGRRQVAL